MREQQAGGGAGVHDGRPDRGASFVEVAVSIVILGMATIAVLTALAAATTTAGVRRNARDAQFALTVAGEAVTDVRGPYVPCATPTEPSYAAAVAVPRRLYPHLAPVTIDTIEYWDGGDGGAWSTTCRFDEGYRLQRITLVVTVDGTRRSLTVVKRPDPDGAPVDDVPSLQVDLRPWSTTDAPPSAGG